jgi:molecular chaperone GrpE (heat shock protein)
LLLCWVEAGTTQELVDTYFRLAADFDNFRKRSETNLVQARDTATADIVKQAC